MRVVPFAKPDTGSIGVGDKVRICNAENMFYTWEGKVSAVFATNMVLDPHRYQVRFLIANNSILLPPLLFKLGELEKST